MWWGQGLVGGGRGGGREFLGGSLEVQADMEAFPEELQAHEETGRELGVWGLGSFVTVGGRIKVILSWSDDERPSGFPVT